MDFDLIGGISYPVRALRMFSRHPKLLQYLVIPMAINIVVGVILYAFSLRWAWRTATDGYLWINETFVTLIDRLPQWLQWLDYGASFLAGLLGLIFVAAIFIFVGLILVQFGVILGAPWYGQLSEQIEKLRTNRIEIVEVGIVRDIGRAILFELKKLALVFSFSPILLGLNFIPAFGSLVSSAGGMTLTLTVLCLDFFDAPLERRRLSFRQKLGMVYKAFPASGGFAFVCLWLISVPLLNLVTIPICVSSGTMFVCDRLLPKLNLPKAETVNSN
ncbi:MAG: EI24 domain-containing protein [Limnothrix sp.]